MKIIKYTICISAHCFLIWLGISYYQQYKEKDLVVKATLPIEVYIIDIHYRAKSANTCDVIYRGKEYKNIIFYNNKVKKYTFNNNFYYIKIKIGFFVKVMKRFWQ